MNPPTRVGLDCFSGFVSFQRRRRWGFPRGGFVNLFVIISASLGYATESIFGFGGSIVTFLLLTQSIAAKEAVSMLPLFAIAGSLFILLSDYRSVKWAVVGKILLFALPGLVLGSLFMRFVPETVFRLFVLAIILLYGFNLILGKDPSVPLVWRKPLYVLGGFIIGATSLGVFLIPVAGPEFGRQRAYRASFALLWLATAAGRIPMYMLNGVLTREGFRSAASAVPFILVAILIGYYIHRLIPETHYKRYVGIVIVLVAVVNLFTMFF